MSQKHVRELTAGDVILFDDGGAKIVRSAAWGDGLIAGFHHLPTAREVIIEFEDGSRQPAHPAEPVNVVRS